MNLFQEKSVVENTAQRSDRDLKAIVDISPYPVFIHHNGIARYANKLTKKLLKEDEDADAYGWKLTDYVYEEDLPKLKAAIEQHRNEETTEDVMEFRLQDKVGNIHRVQAKSTSILFGGEICRLAHVYNFDKAEQAIEEVKEKEALLAKLIETIPDSIVVVNSVTRKKLYSNKSFIEHLGYTAADHEGEDEFHLIARKIHPDDLPKLSAARDLINDPGNAGLFAITEYRILDKAGKWRWVLGRSCSLMPAKDGVGRVNFGIVQDITEIKEKEQDLINYHTFQEKVNATSPALITIFDVAKLTSAYRSQDMAEWFKYEPGTLPERSIDIIHPEYRQEALDAIKHVTTMNDGEVQTTVYPGVQGDGTLKFVLTRSAVFQRDPEGKVTHILMVHSDITDLKETESKLDKSEETRKAILHSIPDMVVIMDREGTILDFYPNELLRTVLESVNFTGKNITELVSPENSEMLKEAIEIAMWQNKLHTINFEHRGSATSYYMELRISPFSDNKVIIVGRDISEQRHSQDKIDHYNKELFAKNQELERYITSNSELEKFAYIASHDLREPLRSLTGFAQLLQKRNEGKLTRESEEFIENIIHGAQRMNTLVSGLLEYSRITSAGKPFAVVHIPDLIKKVRSDLKISIEENHSDLILFDLPDLYCDELQMRQLFQNVISNAIKFRSEQNPIIKISAEKTERHWQFKIEDNGIGIDMRYKDQVFQIFTRLHAQDKYQGSGIGLSVCKKIIERHGGQIWLESTPGHGTTIFFTVLI
ncbi:MAG: sensory transduction histidine kinase [Bacteroidetes bacterium]|nr:sensory transduction histidine kinase [Bacteroidota bacterium]